MNFVTPLRYPGGKGRLGPWLAGLMRHNQISGGWYVEPYAGGAGAALYLLMQGCVSHIVINDVDPVIYAFWSAVLNDNERFVKLVSETSLTMDEWHRQRVILSNPEKYETTAVGFAAFFLNRTNRSGILSAGVIGGKNQNGPYKIDARYNKPELCERIKYVGSMRKHISIYGLDALDLVEKINDQMPDKSLVYFDPPYFKKGNQLYRNYYNPEDHAHISEAVCKLQKPWVVTYDNCLPIKELYSKAKSAEFSLHYSTHRARPRATEAMFYGNLDLHEAPFLSRKR